MPRKKTAGQQPPAKPEIIVQQPMEEVMRDSMIPYAEYVIMDRALPRVEDGLKPVQRRILYTMMELGNTPDKPHKKSARVAGDAMGKYHPHGDSSIYDAMVRMAQDFVMRAPLVDGHGNFGSIDGDSAAAMRYTEVRMAPLALELLRDIDKETVPFSLNFDDTLKEPDILPGRFPNLLVNGAMGIAVGLATSIPPHNLGETVRAVIAQMDKPDITTRELMQYLPAPDFPTGGIIVNPGDLEAAYETGRGRIAVRSRCEIEELAGGRSQIVIHEIPYQVNKAAMLEKIQRLSQERKDALGGIGDIRDESDRNGLRAVIELKKGADAQKILQYLYKYSDLQVNFGVNMVAIADGKPRQLPLKEINRYYIAHQEKVVTLRTRYDLERAEEREHILEGLYIAIQNIDEVIAIIKASPSTREAQKALMKRFDLTSVQAQAILDMRLARLTALEVDKIVAELEAVRKQITRLKAILKSHKKLMEVIKSELTEIAKRYDTPRRTSIEDTAGEESFNPEDYIVVEDVRVTVTRAGYVKRMAEKAYQRSNRETGMEDLAADDGPLCCLEATTAQRLYLFTSGGAMLQIPVSELPEGRWRDKGTALFALHNGFAKGERVVAAFVYEAWPEKGELLFITKGGMGKKSAAADYVTRMRKLTACAVKDGDELVAVEWIRRGAGLVLLSRKGMALMTRHSQIPVQGRATRGVKAMALEGDDEILLATQLEPEGEIALITDAGYGKRLPYMAFSAQNRGGKGMRAVAFYKNGANGRALACALPVAPHSRLQVEMASGEKVLLAAGELPAEKLEGRGAPTGIMVVLGNEIVNGFACLD